MLAVVKNSLKEMLEIMASDLGVEVELILGVVVISADALIGDEHESKSICAKDCLSCRRWDAINEWATEAIGICAKVHVSGRQKPHVAIVSFSPSAILVSELVGFGWPDRTTREEEEEANRVLTKGYEQTANELKASLAPAGEVVAGNHLSFTQQ